MELRESVRYSLDLPLTFAWTDKGGNECHGTGFTRDISSGGMYVFSNCCPDESVAVQCSVLLPRLNGAESMGGIEAVGRVVRRTSREIAVDEPAGFALIGDCMLLSLRASSRMSFLKEKEERNEPQMA